MTSTSVLFIIIGLFIIVNAANFVGVFKGDKTINFSTKPEKTRAHDYA